jgi:internalin A
MKTYLLVWLSLIFLHPQFAISGEPTGVDSTKTLTHYGLEDSVRWLLEIGAKLTYLHGKKPVNLADVRDLPRGPVEFNRISLSGADFQKGNGLNGKKFTDADLDRLAALRGCRRIDLVGYEGMSDRAFAFLDESKDLEILNLRRIDATNNLGVRLSKLRMLHSLTLWSCPEVEDGFLEQMGPTAQRLETLVLTGSHVGDNFAQGLTPLSRLEELRMGGTRLTDKGLVHVAGLNALRALEVGGTEVTLQGLACLSGSKIRELGYLSTEMPDFADQVIQLAKMFPKLETVALSGGEFRAEHAEALQVFRDLKSLNLLENVPDQASVQALAKLKGIQELQCHSAKFTDGHLAGVAKLTQCKRLILNNTGVTNRGLENLQRCRHLKFLNLGDTPVTASGAALLEKEIRGLEVLY